jgi:hypothetical protein
MISSIWKFVGWDVAGCWNACISLSQKFSCFVNEGKPLSLSLWSGLDMWLHFALTSLNTWMNAEGASHLISVMSDRITASERNFDCGNCNCYQMWHISQFWERKVPLILTNTRKKCTFFNKNSTPVFNIYASMRPQPTFFNAIWC